MTSILTLPVPLFSPHIADSALKKLRGPYRRSRWSCETAACRWTFNSTSPHETDLVCCCLCARRSECCRFRVLLLSVQSVQNNICREAMAQSNRCVEFVYIRVIYTSNVVWVTQFAKEEKWCKMFKHFASNKCITLIVFAHKHGNSHCWKVCTRQNLHMNFPGGTGRNGRCYFYQICLPLVSATGSFFSRDLSCRLLGVRLQMMARLIFLL